jgi:hypothetical protein
MDLLLLQLLLDQRGRRMHGVGGLRCGASGCNEASTGEGGTGASVAVLALGVAKRRIASHLLKNFVHFADHAITHFFFFRYYVFIFVFIRGLLRLQRLHEGRSVKSGDRTFDNMCNGHLPGWCSAIDCTATGYGVCCGACVRVEKELARSKEREGRCWFL